MNSFVKNNNHQTQHPSQIYAKLLKQFPKIKFSYELKSYKKVYTNTSTNHDNINGNNNIYLIIPKGKKYFVWFKNDECLFLELDNDKQVINVTSKKTSRIFPNDTIFYGTHFYYRTTSNSNVLYYFTIENVHYYNGINLDTTQPVFEKFKTLHLAFTTVILEKTFQVEIGLPYIDSSFDRISDIKPFYSAYCIQKKNLKNEHQNIFYSDIHVSSTSLLAPVPVPTVSSPNNTRTINTITNKSYNKNYNIGGGNKYKIFIVSADIQNDIYHLTDPDSKPHIETETGQETVVKLIASIPDYKTSVMMNSLFRNIKENKSLDALEESDDEDEFENTNIDKFVDLSKTLKMKCIFSYKFKKWTPIECV